MWKEPDPDPGGERSSAQTSKEFTDLQDQNEQQQLMIAQLKEMLRKEQSSVPQEKVEEYINTLSKVKAKRTRLKKEVVPSREKHTSSTGDNNKNEKVNLLKQQLEENKAKLAERGMREKGIEEMVTILKAQFNDSQQLMDSTPGLSVPDNNLDYNKNTSQEELYNILLVKEKKITEYIEKTRKQEAKILDLQENLKEKDSVIDARTKAITLMSDSLSKKSKDSLDALDETRDQMRKMQEEFIKLESEMKARQMKLLDDLKSKNFQIAELQENNEQLVKEKNEYLKHSNDSEKREDDNYENLIVTLQQKLDQTTVANHQHLDKISDLEKKLQESLDMIDNFKMSGTTENNESEFTKLKKQLDESNKNMIKIKAQSKSKIKELTKKIDSFKKISDANALVVQLQNEITKLNERIAELEEEKGSLQLNMVDSTDFTKVDTREREENEAFQTKYEETLRDVEEKDKIISLLDSEIISLKEEVNNLNEKIAVFSHLKNVQVTSEIESIQIEEQLDNLKYENKKLQEDIEHLTSEKHHLMETIEEITKEKQDLNTKLDNYIQENIDLIDKLEKLSAEKVSSVESIEIVEGLTQQEKLELAAYQRTIAAHPDESAKGLEDDNSYNPPELNESVLQLNEDSTELLNKIEMFNMERKEVMVKLEALRDENNRLSLKLNEVENNRDILAETYEHLQNEKEEIQKENEKLMERVKKSELVISDEEPMDDTSKFNELENHCEKLLSENECLKKKLKELETKIHEKDNLESELIESRVKIEELETNVKTSLEEIKNYQSIIEENKIEFINSARVINELQNNLNEKEGDIKELNILINDLNNVVSDLQRENEKLTNFEIMDKQVNELKTALSEQMELAQVKEQQYMTEISSFKELLNDLESRHADLNYQLFETIQELEKKNKEIETLMQEQLEKDEMIKSLNQKQEEEKNIHGVIEEMKQKYLKLQTQLEGNNDSLEKTVEDLSLKNKEQLEKMKKIAANLKKKSQAYLDLEKKFIEEKEKWETEVNKKENVVSERISSLEVQVEFLTEELNKKTKQLEETEFKLKELSEITDNLEQQKTELQNSLLEIKHKQDRISEVSLKQELSSSLHEEFDSLHGNNESMNEDKIKELELIIETNESDLIHYRERVQKLEEDISQLLEAKENLENITSTLEEKLVLTSKTVEDRVQLGEDLSNKLSEVEANNAGLTEKLEETEKENRNVNEKNKEQEELINRLKIKLKKAHEKVTQLKTAQSSMEELENNNIELKKQVTHLDILLKHAHEENEEMQSRNQSDYERIESDYQAQLEELVTCKNELTVECEKLKEAVKNLQEREEELLSEMTDYKQKLQDVERELGIKIQQLTEDLNITTTNWQGSLDKIEGLEHQLVEAQKQIIKQRAEEIVEEVVIEATERVFSIHSKQTQTETVTAIPVNVSEGNEPEIVQTISWSETQGHDEDKNWFDNVRTPQEPAQLLEKNSEQNIVVTKEDLQNKIKALEILLYNVDKEKEEILSQCSGMLNELTRLVYEKINSDNPNIPKFNPSSAMSVPSELESQILSPDDVVDAASDKKSLQQIEFDKCSSSFGPQKLAVLEEIVQPKKAYLTYQTGAEAFGENDDGWGWGPEEAKLEEEHQHQATSTPQVQGLKLEIAHLNEKLQVFQMERDKHLDEIKQLQVKSGKLIKKCKELKQKNDQLLEKSKKADNSDFFDLEQTIQEELKLQIVSLEKRVQDIQTELDKEKLEKIKILKCVDVLSSANDKMVEMKEIQESEVIRWKRKYEDIEEKLRLQDWTSDGFSEGTKEKQLESVKSDSQNTEELQQMIKELSLDNEELQTLLNEQRQLRIEAEKNRNSFKTEVEFMKLSAEYEEKLKLLQQEIIDKNKEFGERFDEKDKLVTELLGEMKMKEGVIQSLEENLKNLNESNNELKTSLEENILIAQQAQQIHISNYQQQLQEHNTQLESLLTEKTAIAAELKSSLDENVSVNDSLRKQVEYLINELENIKQKYNDLQVTSSDDIQKLQNQLESQKQNSSQINPEEANLVVQQLTNHNANTLLELFEKFCKANDDYENLKLLYEEVVGVNKSTSNKITEVQQELNDLKKEFSELQNSSSKNILDLQCELEEQKQKFDLLQTEKTAEIDELEKQLLRQTERDVETSVSESTSNDLIQQVRNLETLLTAKEENIDELEKVVDDLRKQRATLDEDMKQLKNLLNEKQIELDNVVAEMEEKFAKTVSELEQKWEVQVDERGNTVAESWKYHLNMVESEFSVVQERLKNELNELEEKCNALVNENNELRKNVDTEIKNEVDRTTVMQQQINDSQQVIKELTERLHEEQVARVTFSEQLANFEREKMALQDLLSEKGHEISSLKVIIETTQKQFDEKREVIEEIVNILEKNTSWPLSCEKEDVLNELQRQLNIINERDEEVSRLNAHISELQSQASTFCDKEKEIARLNILVTQLETQMEQVKKKNREIVKESEIVEQMQKQVQEKEDEILRMSGIVEEYKMKIDKNQEEINNLQQVKNDSLRTLEMYKQKLEELIISNDSLKTSGDEKSREIDSLKHSVETLKFGDMEKQKLETDMSKLRNDYYLLQQTLTECQHQMSQASQDLASKTYELENVTQQLSYSQRNSEILDTELNRLRDLLDTKQKEYMNSIEEVKQSRFSDLENHYQEILSSKEIDIQTIKTQLNESVANIQNLNEKFNQELAARDEFQNQLQEKINEQNALLEEENNQLSEMRGIIEQQVIKIEQLKEELFQKCNDYDSIIAEMDISRKAITQQPTLSENSNISTSPRPNSDELSEPASRAELDLALYMLHQRDVRCEELMVELALILEERDTLQLRLSNALRENEETRQKITKGIDQQTSPSSGLGQITPLTESSSIMEASAPGLATEVQETPLGNQDLANKLSELKRVGYKRDKTFVDEQELRRYQQMSIMQQHISEASKLPPEAQAKLVDASYTLSRDVQSPSKVLLNWLWGKSTPKVNES